MRSSPDSVVRAGGPPVPSPSSSSTSDDDSTDEVDSDFGDFADDLAGACCSAASSPRGEAGLPAFAAVGSSMALLSREEFGRAWRNVCPLVFLDGLACRRGWGAFADGWAAGGEDSSESDLQLMSAVRGEVSCFVSPTDGRTFLKNGGICHNMRLPWETAARMAIDGTLAVAGQMGQGLAYTRANLSDLTPAMTKLLDFAPLEDMLGISLQTRLCGLWVSSPGCVTPLHFDTCHGLLCQVRGEKRVLLADPGSTRSLYINPSSHANPQSSRVNLLKWISGDQEQRQRFPNVNNVEWHEVILKPGQALYTPPFWWHHVETLGAASVSILLPFDPDIEELSHPCGLVF